MTADSLPTVSPNTRVTARPGTSLPWQSTVLVPFIAEALLRSGPRRWSCFENESLVANQNRARSRWPAGTSAPGQTGRGGRQKTFAPKGTEISHRQFPFAAGRNRSHLSRRRLPGLRGSQNAFVRGMDAACRRRERAQAPALVASRTRLPRAAQTTPGENALRHCRSVAARRRGRPGQTPAQHFHAFATLPPRLRSADAGAARSRSPR